MRMLHRLVNIRHGNSEAHQFAIHSCILHNPTGLSVTWWHYRTLALAECPITEISNPEISVNYRN